jgi:hypothetical protein
VLERWAEVKALVDTTPSYLPLPGYVDCINAWTETQGRDQSHITEEGLTLSPSGLLCDAVTHACDICDTMAQPCDTVTL